MKLKRIGEELGDEPRDYLCFRLSCQKD